MSKHERYREMCALAALGEIPPKEAQELEKHVETCKTCRRLYSEFAGINASFSPLTANEDTEIIEALRSATRLRVLENASTAGVSRPRPFAAPAMSLPGVTDTASWHWVMSCAMALLIIGAFWAGVEYQMQFVHPTAPMLVNLPAPGVPNIIGESLAASVRQRPDASTTQPEYPGKSIEQLNQALESKQKQFEQVLAQNSQLQNQVQQQVENLRETEGLLQQKTVQLEQLQQTQNSNMATVVALNYEIGQLRSKVKDQSDRLGRERDMLASGREIRNIIGARNLHIVDVYDTDAKGHTQKPFARAFYTEGRSLVFYAYDLPPGKPDSSTGDYVAWGEKNGRKVSIKNLGILINDDQGQKRWVLSFNDPKVLAEIDSVFITLEPAGRDAATPSGKRMLTAYLEDQVNHP